MIISKNSQWVDLVFEYRNKEYGAYILRYIYPYYVTISASIILFLFLAIIVGPQVVKGKRVPPSAEQQVTMIDYTKLAPPPPIEKMYIPPPPIEAVKKVRRYEAPKIVEDEVKPEDEMLSMDDVRSDLDTTKIDTEEGAGRGGEDVLVVYVPPPEPEREKVAPPPEPEPVIIVKPPEFPGGDKALVKWLGSHLQYPKMAEMMGIEGLVVVEFVVGIDGKLSDVTVVQSIHKLIDEEAIRLVKSMPNWIPGESTTGVAVAKRKLPVRFTLR